MRENVRIGKRGILMMCIALCGTMFFSCKAKKEVEEEVKTVEVVESYRDSWIKLQRSGCYGTCPIYNVTIYGNGIVKYEGKKYVDRIGMYIGHIEPEVFTEIMAMSKEYGFMDMDSIYSASITDLPSSQITLLHNQKTKSVREDGEGPKELIRFQRYLDGLVSKVDDWKEVMRK